MTRWASLKRLCAGPPQYGLNIPASEYTTEGVRFIRTTDIDPNGKLTDKESAVHVDPARVPPHALLREGDILFSRSGSLGRCHRVRGSSVGASFAGYLVRFRPLPETDSRFLEYCAATSFVEGAIAADATTSTISNFNAERYGLLQVPFHRHDDQQAIADFLDTETNRIDALIVKKRRMIGLLATRFQALVAEHLEAAADRVPLKRLVVYKEGPGIMAEDFRDSGIPLIRVAGVGGPFVTLAGCNYLDPEAVRRRWAHFALREGDFVISASASMGIVSKVGAEADGSIPYTGLIRFRPAPFAAVSMEFVRYFLSSADFVSQIDVMKTGTAIQHFGPTHLDAVTLPALPLDQQEAAARSFMEADAHTSKVNDRLTRQIVLLQEHRQALITAAVTGALQLPA